MSMIAECPWCAGTKLTWHIPAYSRHLHPECEDCGAQAPPVHVPTGPRDQDALNALAIKQWNARA